MKHKLLLAAAVVLLLCGGALFGVAHAQSFRSGNTATIGPDEVVDSSLWLAGRTVDIAGEVNGDVFCAGQTVTISGTVHGDVLCAAQTLVISGTIGGDVRSAAQTTTLSGRVQRNISAAAQSFVQEAKSIVAADASVAAGDVVLHGSVGRDAAVAGQTVILSGQVGRNATATADQVRLDRTAKIGGNLSYTSQNTAQIASGAVVGGKTTKSAPKERQEERGLAMAGVGIGFLLYLLVAGLIVALVLVLLFPHALQAITSHAIRSPWKPLLVGLVAALAVPALILVLMLTIVGIPLALLLLVVWLLAQALSLVVSAYYVGRLVWRKRGNAIVMMLTGFLLLFVLCLIPLVDIIVLLAAVLMGIGMLLLELKRRWPEPRYHVE